MIPTILTALLCGALVLPAQTSPEATVRAQVDAFAAAFRDADADRLKALLATDYVHTNGGSRPLTADQWLTYVRTRRDAIAAGRLVVTTYQNSELDIRVHGDAAIVTGVNVSEGTENGAPFRRALRFTQLWVLRHGRWLRAAFQDAPAAN